MKRGYFVHGNDDACGLAVVATSAKEAKKLAWETGELNAGWADDWINIRARWKRNAIVDDLSIGVVHDPRVGLLCGIYHHLDEYPCDGCGRDEMVYAHDGAVLCECCIETSR